MQRGFDGLKTEPPLTILLPVSRPQTAVAGATPGNIPHCDIIPNNYYGHVIPFI
jgi:hypothetical protein